VRLSPCRIGANLRYASVVCWVSRAVVAVAMGALLIGVACLGVACLGVACLGVGCRDRLSEAACSGLRSEAFDIVNGVHPCKDDADCLPSEWPGCAKPLNIDDHRRIAAIKAKFDQGQCQEPAASCRDLTEVHCDRNFCVFRPPATGGSKDDGR